jgi:hypothetical protein
MKVTIQHEYAGMSDYWRGNGRRWNDDCACLFAFYGFGTTLRDCVDQWVSDFENGGDADSIPAEIKGSHVRAAILASLVGNGVADYHNGAVCGPSWILDDPRVCRDCGKAVGDEHTPECEPIKDEAEHAEDPYLVLPSECDDVDDDSESPIWVVLLELEDDDDDDENNG